EVGHLEVVPLAGGLELLLLVELGDGGTVRAALGSSARSPVTGSIALVGAGSRHLVRVTFG
ncbi:MAG: hypothetical protein ABIQ58_06575, partial [Candidatus Limnocylindrales bacterium]